MVQDGIILCTLMNVLKPGVCKEAHNISKVKVQAFRVNRENENVSFFLKAAEKYGVPKHNLFQTVDLSEAQNLAQVQVNFS